VRPRTLSPNEATQVPHPRSGLRPPGGFVRFSRAPEKRAFGDLSPLLRALFRTKCTGELSSSSHDRLITVHFLSAWRYMNAQKALK